MKPTKDALWEYKCLWTRGYDKEYFHMRPRSEWETRGMFLTKEEIELVLSECDAAMKEMEAKYDLTRDEMLDLYNQQPHVRDLVEALREEHNARIRRLADTCRGDGGG